MSSRTADQWFEAYGESHQNPTNKLIHWICVPTIVASLLGMLWSVPVPSLVRGVPYVNWATVLIALSMVFYLRLSVALAIGMLVYSIAVVLAIVQLERLAWRPLWQISVAVFVIAWVGQFIGHKIEGKKPSFFQDLQFLLIGPIWLLGALYRRLKVRY
jgi:uncharacterized membrane protein YGL010W